MIFNSKLVGLLIVVAFAYCEAKSSTGDLKLNCRSVELKPFDDLTENPSHSCNIIKKEGSGDKSLFIHFDLINNCLCNLVSRQSIWSAIVDFEVQKVYDIVMRSLEKSGDRQTLLMRMDRFKSPKEMLSSVRRRMLDSPELYNTSDDSGYLGMEKLAIRLNPDKFWQIAEAACYRLNKTFEPLWAYMKPVEKFSGNKDLGNIVASQDENLFKAVVVHKICKMLAAK